MADNVETNPGTGGATFATDEIATVHYPRTKVGFGADGEYHDVDPDNPMPVEGANIEGLLQEIAIRLIDIADSVGNLMPDASGRLRVNAETVVSHPVTLSTVTTVSTVTSMTNQAQIGGYAANQHIMALLQMNEAQLRNNVVFS